jgi:superfamily II DNA or RNA helicase
MTSDFADYSVLNGWSVEDNCHCITGGVDKRTSKHIIISTWQSVYKLTKDTDYFDQFECVICDEVHLATGASLTSCMESSIRAPYKIGLTGTLKDAKTDKLQLEALFGPPIKMVSTKELMDRNVVSGLNIKAIALQYDDRYRKVKRDYREEIDFVVSYPPRNMFIVKLCKALKGNTLVLFQFIEKQGKILEDLLSVHCPEKKVFYIDGSVKGKDREAMRSLIEKEDNCIVLASYATTSTGVSINRLDNAIFASPYKSKIKVLQSIGRILRLSEHKDGAMLFDITDDLSWRTRKNFGIKHFTERITFYREEGFRLEVSTRNI